MPTVPIFTYRDAVRHVIDFLGASVTEQTIRDARRAVRNAARELAQAARWSYMYAEGRLNTSAPYSTGTIAYTNSTRALTLTSGTWPTWSAYGVVVISNVTYQVASRDSNTQLTLSVNSNPGADIASGTTYSIYRDTYPLPSDFASMGTMVVSSNQRAPTYIHPNEWTELQRTSHTTAQPIHFTIVGDQNYFNTMAWKCWPAPNAIYPYVYCYQRRMRPLVYDDYSTGTATVTASSTTVTGTGTAWSSNYVGSVIRLSVDGTNAPEALEWQNPYSVERVITGYTSATSLTVDTAYTAALTGVKYNISDPVDVEDGAMLNAFLRCCEKQVATSKTMRTTAQAKQEYLDALIQAREADSRNFAPAQEGAGGYVSYPMKDWPITLP